MLTQKQLQKLDGWIFIFGYVLVLVAGIFNSSAFNELLPTDAINKIVVALALGLFFLKIFLNEYRVKELGVYVGILVILILSWRQSQSTSLVSMFVFMISSRNVDSRLINKIYLFISIGLMIVIILSALKGLIPNYVYFRDGLSRASLGIIYPTDFAAHVFYILASLAYLRREKFNWKDFLFIVGISYWVYLQTNARLNFVCSLLLAIGMNLVKFDRKNHLQKITWLAPVIGATLMIFLTYIYNPSSRFLDLLNHLLSGRFSIVNEVIHEYGIHAFGGNILQNGLGGPTGLNFNAMYSKYVFIDSSYLRLLLMYGVVSLIVTVTIISMMVKKTTDRYLLVILLVIFISGAIENHMLELAYNPFFLILFIECFKQKNLIKGSV
ncbi:hypothetical protein ACFQAV_11180 [Companilactobacillus huachuanensis]|uniref:Polysaccharide polymerase n=1 Tax=Companilactobacillus huachuanensis TaxID=2559914 RepID=A0ABW1RPC0_9LACO|nr:hypothetical protein [Companilactobacillus huachuanensis]